MATIPDELQVSNEKATALIIPYHQDRNESIEQHIHAVVAHSESVTPLLFSSRSSQHLPEAGLNPLVDCAAYLFFLIGKLQRIKQHHNLSLLHEELVNEVRKFQDNVRNTHRYPDKYLDEYILITSYAVCMVVDDLIGDTTWGDQGRWREHSIVQAVFDEAASQKSFMIILERVVMEPHAYIDVVEFLYICLSFGMRCRNEDEADEFNLEQRGQIGNFLYKFIQAYRGNVSKTLSPYPIRPRKVTSAARVGLTQVLDVIAEQAEAVLARLRSLRAKPAEGETAHPHNEVLVKNLMRLQKRFNSAVNFMRKTMVTLGGEEISLEQLPWYLLIGSSGSGKSSLLSKSNIKFILGKKANRHHRHQLPSAQTFDWWITSGAVLVDVPGSFITNVDRNSAMSEEVWQRFLALTVKSRKNKSMGGVILAISVTELVDKDQRNDLMHDLRCRIQDIQQYFGEDIPVYLTITKMDLLPGFMDFFNDRSMEELTQAWGITLPQSNTAVDTSVFIKRFNALVKILNNQLIQRLHVERDPVAKSNIKDFPLYVERIKDEIAGVLNALKAQGVRFHLRAVYLTSAAQGDQPDHLTTHAEVVDGSEKMLEIRRAPRVRQTPYFIKQFILQGIMQ